MGKINSKTVATRLKLSELAKARDGLITRGIKEKDIQTPSQILRLCVYYMILECKDPKAPPSNDSVNFVRQRWGQTKMTKNIGIDELMDD